MAESDNESQSSPAPRTELTALIGEGPKPFRPSSKRPFQPWHRPRKHYVREHQWLREIAFLTRDLGLQNQVLRYLTLPGDDLLDIRYLHDALCVPQRIRLRYLGFNKAAAPDDVSQHDLNSSIFPVNRLQYVDHESLVIPLDIREVGDPTSQSWHALRKEGAFHAINLDLCGGFAGLQSADGVPSYFKALDWILNVQGSASHDCLLFITTRIDEDSVSENAHSAFHKLIDEVIELCDNYQAKLVEDWKLSPPINANQVLAQLGPNCHFLFGFVQWVIERSIQHGLKATVRGLMSYKTGDTNAPVDDIVSVGIKFSPRPVLPPDLSGLSESAVNVTPEERLCQQSANVPMRVRKCARVDEILKTDREVFNACLAKSTDLLVAAGYDGEKYKEWVMVESHRYPPT